MNPITPAALPALYTQVVALAFVLAFLFGAVAQRTHFCTMGAIADWVNFGDRTRLRQWLLAMGVAIVGTQASSQHTLVRHSRRVRTDGMRISPPPGRMRPPAFWRMPTQARAKAGAFPSDSAAMFRCPSFHPVERSSIEHTADRPVSAMLRGSDGSPYSTCKA